MVQYFFMTDLILDTHGTNNSTAIRNFAQQQPHIACKVKEQYPIIILCPLDVAALVDLISSNLLIIFVADLQEV